MADLTNYLIVALFAITSLTILLSRDWRWSIGALSLQYLGVMIFVAHQWPLGLAAVKLVAGWMAGAVLGLTQFSETRPDLTGRFTPDRFFRLFASGITLLIVFSLAPKISIWLPGINQATIQGSLVLIGIGLLQLGITQHPFQISLGLLTVLSGFEILYAAVEISVLVAGLLAAVTLSLALVGSYLVEQSLRVEQG